MYAITAMCVFIFVMFLAIAILNSLRKNRPMTASELQGYEQEMGRLRARNEWKNR